MTQNNQIYNGTEWARGAYLMGLILSESSMTTSFPKSTSNSAAPRQIKNFSLFIYNCLTKNGNL